jgi:hypothetical protein
LTERPILFAGPLVRAILSGQKTQTRRLVKPQPESVWGRGVALPGNPLAVRSDAYHVHARVAGEDRYLYCPYGAPGDRLWVRETFAWLTGAGRRIVFRADADPPRDRFSGAPIEDMTWASPFYMRRADSRITLEVTDVRAQRLQEISEEDAKAEGVESWDSLSREQVIPGPGFDGALYRDNLHRLPFSDLWDSINAKRAPWDSNPWVWAVSFRRVA